MSPAPPTSPAPRARTRALAVAAAADLLCVLVFVAVGRSSHTEGITLGGLLTTGWPFWVGVAGGYVGVLVFRLAPASPHAAAMVLFKTLLIGMVLRAAVQHDGTPVSFVVVATVFLALVLFGWRLVTRTLVIRRGRTGRDRTPATVSGPRP